MIEFKEAKIEDVPIILALYSEKDIDDDNVIDFNTAQQYFNE